MGEVIGLRRGNASCGLCGGNGRIAYGARPAAMVACPRCCAAVRTVERPERPFHAEARMVPLLAWGALNVAGNLAIGVGLFMLFATTPPAGAEDVGDRRRQLDASRPAYRL